MSTPQIKFDPALMEAVVTRALAARVLFPAEFTERDFHAEADPLYRIKNPDQRAARFRELFARWFSRGQFDRPFADALAELPEVERAVSLVTVTGAASQAEERADLATASGTLLSAESGKLWLGISIQPARFTNRPSLRRWLRHELWHVQDILDPAFEYAREDLASAEAERLPQRVVQDRYAMLWSLAIDARVERTGLLPLRSREERVARAVAAFPGFSEEAHREVVATMGITRGTRHPELVELARRPGKLFSSNAQPKEPAQPLRGSACPLCRFPTFQWADLARGDVAPVVRAISQAYPAWHQAQGVCTTCFDLFSIRSGIWV